MVIQCQSIWSCFFLAVSTVFSASWRIILPSWGLRLQNPDWGSARGPRWGTYVGLSIPCLQLLLPNQNPGSVRERISVCQLPVCPFRHRQAVICVSCEWINRGFVQNLFTRLDGSGILLRCEKPDSQTLFPRVLLCKRGMTKIVIFDQYLALSCNSHYTWKTNSNAYKCDRMVSFPMILSQSWIKVWRSTFFNVK